MKKNWKQYQNLLEKILVSVLVFVTKIPSKTWLTDIYRPKMAKTIFFCPKTIKNMENCVSKTHTDMKSGNQLPKLKPKTFIGRSHYRNQNPKPLLIRAATKTKIWRSRYQNWKQKPKNWNFKEPLPKLKPKTEIWKSSILKPKPYYFFLFQSLVVTNITNLIDWVDAMNMNRWMDALSFSTFGPACLVSRV